MWATFREQEHTFHLLLSERLWERRAARKGTQSVRRENKGFSVHTQKTSQIGAVYIQHYQWPSWASFLNGQCNKRYTVSWTSNGKPRLDRSFTCGLQQYSHVDTVEEGTSLQLSRNTYKYTQHWIHYQWWWLNWFYDNKYPHTMMFLSK